MVSRRALCFAFALLAVTSMLWPTGVDAQIDPVKERVEEDQLVFRVGRAFKGQLIPQERDVFRARSMTLRFRRDDAGNIAGYLLDAGRARNFRFTRKER